MEAVREVLLKSLKGFTMSTLIVDIECKAVIEQAKEMELRGEAESITSLLYSALVLLLRDVKPRLSEHKNNLVINLNMLALKYPLYFWDRLLFLAVRNSDFPWTVYITRSTGANREKYCETKRTLQSFCKGLSAGTLAALDEPYYDYEAVLKATLTSLFNEVGMSEEGIDGMLAQSHNLGDLLRVLKQI